MTLFCSRMRAARMLGPTVGSGRRFDGAGYPRSHRLNCAEVSIPVSCHIVQKCRYHKGKTVNEKGLFKPQTGDTPRIRSNMKKKTQRKCA